MSSDAAPLLTDLLRQVSRSFYLTLRVLPRAIRPQISLAYLLARAADTIADTGLVAVERRLEALRQLRARIQGRGVECAFGSLAAAQGEPAEKVLLDRIEDAFQGLRNLSASDQLLVRRVLDTITAGQELDLIRFGTATAEVIVALPDEAALDDYTYRVAGCVGEFWTEMCLAHAFKDPGTDPEAARAHLTDGRCESFREQGVRFGKGLQLVNILRDLPKDLRQGRCYLPIDRLQALGLEPRDLLQPGTEERLRPLYNALLNKANAHLAAGWDYTNRIPFGCGRVRLGCAWPILIGGRTLALLRIGNPLRPDRRIKVSRRSIRAVLVRSVLFYPVPWLWRELWIEACGGE